MRQRHRSIYYMLFMFVLSLCVIRGELCYSYVMPAEQLIGYMARNFSKYKSLSITQSTLRKDFRGEKSINEKIVIKSPDLFRREVLDQVGEDYEPSDMSYRQLLIANSEDRIRRLLSNMWVDLNKVAFTRLDGVIAYRIGEKGPDKPKLIIEKERFLPLQITYIVWDGQWENIISVKFQDYGELDKGWYPFKIQYSSGHNIIEEEQYTIRYFESNIEVGTSPLQHFALNPDSKRPSPEKTSDIEEERLRKIIRAFEEKYQ